MKDNSVLPLICGFIQRKYNRDHTGRQLAICHVTEMLLLRSMGLWEAMALVVWPSPWSGTLWCAAMTFSRHLRGISLSVMSTWHPDRNWKTVHVVLSFVNLHGSIFQKTNRLRKANPNAGICHNRVHMTFPRFYIWVFLCKCVNFVTWRNFQWQRCLFL